MKYGIVLPYTSARATADLSREAEQAGWDGVFVGDAVWTEDALIRLTAAAMVTERIRLGTMVLAAPLRQPWHLASESLAIDRLSGGRLILGLATGAAWMGWQGFPQIPFEPRTRGDILDDTVDVLTRMYQSKPFDFDGKYYQIRLSLVDEQHYPPKPVQQPRIPLWVVGLWPKMKSMRRILRCDGLFPGKINASGEGGQIELSDMPEIMAFLSENSPPGKTYDLPVEGLTGGFSPTQRQDTILPWKEAGATWWIESTWELKDEELRERVRQGPPRVE